MHWINFLHIYQPSDQSNDILEKVTNESYRPLFEGLLDIPKIKININISGALTELLYKKGYSDVIANIKKLAESGKLEFTESAKYHSLLPFLKEDEMIRQVEKNRKTNRKYFGKVYDPVCFFPPEMAYSEKVAKVIDKMGYKIILIDEIAYNGGKTAAPSDHLFKIEKTDLIAVFRERRVSNSIMSAIVRDKRDFLHLIEDDLDKEKYICTAMDGETFGHHRPSLEKTLFKIMGATSQYHLFFSDLLDHFEVSKEVNPVASTWASTAEDIKKNVQFYSWKNPKNKVHRAQWRLQNHLIGVARKNKLSSSLMEKLDQSLASDQFFWASGVPWWSIEVIEKGAWATLQVLKSIPDISKEDLKKGEEYYKEILLTAFWWQRSGKIESMARKYREAVRIPFKERTLEIGGEKVYNRIVSLMEKEIKKATKEQNFEKAILWRDAIWKLDTKNDIYDLMHAVDRLRLDLPSEFKEIDPELNRLFGKYKEKYDKIKPGQPEERRA